MKITIVHYDQPKMHAAAAEWIERNNNFTEINSYILADENPSATPQLQSAQLFIHFQETEATFNKIANYFRKTYPQGKNVWVKNDEN
ncbi:MAG: hypothetical protein WCJ58_02110 [bacterium]